MKSLNLFLLLTLISFSFQKNAMETVNDMGLGWNLGNTFDCFGTWKEIETPDDQITMWGNVVPTEEMVVTIQKYGFKTVRFPVTWMNFMDSSGKVDSEWMKRVKEVVDWIIDAGMYCILNVHHDGVAGNWLAEGASQKDKYVTLWKQIATEFKSYDDHLVLESMNEVEYKKGSDFDFTTLHTLTQAFVDTVRATGGNNAERLLLISGMNTNLEQTCSSGYKMPTDKANKLAISIHYYLPPQFTVESDKEPWTWTDDQGEVHEITPLTKWGTESDYKEMVTNFETMKKAFADKGIPVILGEVGVLTEEKKDKASIREFLYAQYSFAAAYDGFMSVLWDTSKNTAGDMNFYNRETDKWYDEKIRDNFVKISEGKYVIILNQILKHLQMSMLMEIYKLVLVQKKLKKLFSMHQLKGLKFMKSDLELLVLIKLENGSEIQLPELMVKKKMMDHILLLLMLVVKILMIMFKFKNGGEMNI